MSHFLYVKDKLHLKQQYSSCFWWSFIRSCVLHARKRGILHMCACITTSRPDLKTRCVFDSSRSTNEGTT